MNPASRFVRVDPTRPGFLLGDQPYAFLGANFWFGPSLGSPGEGGNRARLTRELDTLDALGVRNLRIMAGSEGPNGEPWRMRPALQPAPGRYDEDQLRGLDWLLAEMRERNMKAVVCLSNMWQWSGGFAAYVSWARGGEAIPYPGHSNAPDAWDRYQDYSSLFYELESARALYVDHVRALVGRTSSVTGEAYADDPTIMAWQLANEPRGVERSDAYLDWVKQSAALIKSLDANHLVSIGSEGKTPWSNARTRFVEAHELRDVDYATCHVWVQNWLWYDPARGVDDMRRAAGENVAPYVADHVRISRELGKPLVLEEFGISRDAGSCDPDASCAIRDEYYARVFELVAREVADGGALAGVNFWAWSGEGRPRSPGADWQPGDDYTGDPPHEPQGWYGVYDRDEATLDVIRRHAARING